MKEGFVSGAKPRDVMGLSALPHLPAETRFLPNVRSLHCKRPFRFACEEFRDTVGAEDLLRGSIAQLAVLFGRGDRRCMLQWS